MLLGHPAEAGGIGGVQSPADHNAGLIPGDGAGGIEVPFLISLHDPQSRGLIHISRGPGADGGGVGEGLRAAVGHELAAHHILLQEGDGRADHLCGLFPGEQGVGIRQALAVHQRTLGYTVGGGVVHIVLPAGGVLGHGTADVLEIAGLLGREGAEDVLPHLLLDQVDQKLAELASADGGGRGDGLCGEPIEETVLLQSSQLLG